VAKGAQASLSSTRALHSPQKSPVGYIHVNGGHDREEDKPRSNAVRVRKPSHPNVNVSNPNVIPVATDRYATKETTDIPAKPSCSEPLAPSVVFTDYAREMYRLLTHATNADECRLIVDMFLVKSGLQLEAASHDTPYPSPPLEAAVHLPSVADIDLENSLVELFLGGPAEAEAEVDPEAEAEVEVEVEIEIETEEDDEPLSPTDTVVSKEVSLVVPVSPHDTSFHPHENTTTQPVLKDIQEVTLSDLTTP